MPLLCSFTSFTSFTSSTSSTSSTSFLSRHRHALHILNNRRSKLRRPHLGGSRHQPFQIICDALLLNCPRNAVLDQLRRFLPAQKLEHHRAGKHHGAGINHILVRILRRSPVRRLEHAKSIANVRPRRHPQSSNLCGASV